MVRKKRTPSVENLADSERDTALELTPAQRAAFPRVREEMRRAALRRFSLTLRDSASRPPSP